MALAGSRPPRHENQALLGRSPDRLYMEMDTGDDAVNGALAELAVILARQFAPKLSGEGAAGLYPLWGPDHIGIGWDHPRMWMQEIGTNPFTMRNLQGKTIPMWLDDPRGVLRAQNPKAKTRVTVNGRVQVLIFRKAAKVGSRKDVQRKIGGVMQTVNVPRSYPGAPGRIATREAAAPQTTQGKIGGAIARRNIGVRWRHPGLSPRSFMLRGMVEACRRQGITPTPVIVSSEPWGGR